MAIKGYFRFGINPLPAPFVQAYIQLPRLHVDGYIDFLIDTGSDNTVLHSRDTITLGVNFRNLRRSTLTESVGVGGTARYYKEPATLAFVDEDGTLYRFSGPIHIGRKSNPNESPPSLLGRDILNMCSLTVDRPANDIIITPIILEAPPQTAQVQLPLTAT